MTDEILELHQGTDLVEHMQVQDIVYYKYSMEYDDTVEAADEDHDGSVRIEFGTAIRARPTGIDYRCSVRVPVPAGELFVDAAILYDAGKPIRAHRDAVQEFGDRAAFAALYAYLRQAVTDLSNRLPGKISPLPLLRPREVSFDLRQYPEIIEPKHADDSSAPNEDQRP